LRPREGEERMKERAQLGSARHRGALTSSSTSWLPRFVAHDLHEAILGEGLLPPDLLREAVLEKLGAG